MEEYQIIKRDKLSRKDSKRMIAAFANHGNHIYNFKFRNESELRIFFSKNKKNYDDVVEQCRSPEKTVPFFENLIESTTHTHNVRVENVNLKTGASKQIIEGSGTFSEAAYWTQVEKSKEAFERSIKEKSYYEFLNAIVLAIASIEAYINHRAIIWNENSSNPIKFIDNKKHKVSLEEKLTIWVPKMSHSKGIDKSSIYWSVFKEFMRLRDNYAIHIKDPTPSVTYKELVRKLNKFKYLMQLMYKLHLLFNEKVPRIIIRSMYERVIELRLLKM